jgi:pantoate--beta-alanine ligase
LITCVADKGELLAALAGVRADGRNVGFVPTMGALHAGHLSLVDAARARTDCVVASIFVNPTQFAPGEDFERYPRRLEEDSEMLGDAGVELLFAPDVSSMYAQGPQLTVDPGPLARLWEGEVRPAHFAGVATVVAKFFGIVRPDAAFFGEKDFQQLVIVKRMALDLQLAVEVVGCPTIRDTDGLALSSRNAYLSPAQRQAGLGLPEALAAARGALATGERLGADIETTMRAATAARSGDALTLDYAAVVDPETLEPMALVNRPARAIIAGRVGGTRLIDNCALVPPVGGGA